MDGRWSVGKFDGVATSGSTGRNNHRTYTRSCSCSNKRLARRYVERYRRHNSTRDDTSGQWNSQLEFFFPGTTNNHKARMPRNPQATCCISRWNNWKRVGFFFQFRSKQQKCFAKFSISFLLLLWVWALSVKRKKESCVALFHEIEKYLISSPGSPVLVPEMLVDLSTYLNKEDQLFSLWLKLRVPENIVEHYIFNSKKSLRQAALWLLMYWNNGVIDKSEAYTILVKAMGETDSSQQEEEMNLFQFWQEVRTHAVLWNLALETESRNEMDIDATIFQFLCVCLSFWIIYIWLKFSRRLNGDKQAVKSAKKTPGLNNASHQIYLPWHILKSVL